MKLKSLDQLNGKRKKLTTKLHKGKNKYMKYKMAYIFTIIFLFTSSLSFAQVDEFTEIQDKTEFQESSNTEDEFAETTDEFSDDEFANADEFASTEDEFSEFTEGDVLDEKAPVSWNSLQTTLLISRITCRFRMCIKTTTGAVNHQLL